MAWNLQLQKVILEKNNTKGNLIETITAEENEYPSNGIKDGKWYVRKEIVQEHKLCIKDYDGKSINIASIYFKDNNSNISNISKAYSDKELLWEKSAVKTISWTTDRQVSPFAKQIDIPVSYQLKLKNKQLLSVKIGELGEVSQEYIKVVFPTNDRFQPHISFSKSFDELLGTNDWIHVGTQITVKYK